MKSAQRITRVAILYFAPAVAGTLFGIDSSVMMTFANIVSDGTTTTFSGAPACDCGSSNHQCGCITK